MKSYLRRIGVLGALLLTLQSSALEADVAAFYGRAYFGDPIGRLSDTEAQAFERGARLFAKTWSSGQGVERNANSCVSCHSVPAPGGSGMSNTALVATRVVAGRSLVLYRPASIAVPGMENRRTPPLFGLGLLESADALTKEDGGRRKFFGALAEHQSISAAVEHAIEVELGLTTERTCRRHVAAQNAKCAPDVPTQDLFDLVQYVRFLAAPPRLYADTRVEELGRASFKRLGCAACHTPTFSTMKSKSTSLRAEALNGYTDFQVHDVGGAYRVRTTALWGLNSYGPPYWHDGTAKTIDEAIRLHNGQATDARRSYEHLSEEERDVLLTFLKGL